ncbi:Beta-hexosaminidase 3 [Zea mays]|uniref:beta-N-acetylhexosaminidase n=1 Tax=Zea mays TaxID=4577 RepID=A0A1D6M4G0_MAIZE|nr:Beta-hexosaminidase 3 [Zea mays]
MAAALRPRLLVLLAVAAAATGPSCAGAGRVDLWPMPASVARGAQTLLVSKDLRLSTAGSSYPDGKGILTEAFRRMVAVVELDHAINGTYSRGAPVLAGVHVAVRSPNDELNFGVDESYRLSVPATGDPLYAQIEAQTVYGALHALETFSQLCSFDFNANLIELHSAPWTILDAPRFPYRGLLIDTSRHYLPVPVIKGVIDSMTFSKLIFILCLDSNVGITYLCSWISQVKMTYQGFTDFSKIFKFKFVHLGGDEVNTSCWSTTPHIKSWLMQHSMNESDAYRYFVLRAQKIAISHGYDIINWEETFNNFGDKLDRKTVVHNWLGSGVAEKVVAAGLRCIVSNQDKWYLDHLDATWEGFYTNEPLTNIYNPEQQKLVLGGEVCMWGEHIDASDIQQTIWPRAAAAAERLWTPIEKLAKDTRSVTARLARFRCLLNQRGVAAAPLAGYGRSAPSEPGSCLRQ